MSQEKLITLIVAIALGLVLLVGVLGIMGASITDGASGVGEFIKDSVNNLPTQ